MERKTGKRHLPHTYWFADFETVNETDKTKLPKDRVYLWGLMNGKDKSFEYGVDINSFIDWIKGFRNGSCMYCKRTARRRTCLYKKHVIYFHNFSRFDGYFLIKALAKRKDFKQQAFTINKEADITRIDKYVLERLERKRRKKLKNGYYRVFVFKRDILTVAICYDDYYFEFRCSAKLLPQCSVANLGSDLGFPKLDLKHVPRYYKNKEQLDQEVLEYCKRDTEIIREALFHFTGIIYYKNLKLSASATAYHDWMRRSWERLAELGGVQYEVLYRNGGQWIKHNDKFYIPQAFMRQVVLTSIFPTKWLKEQKQLRDWYKGGIVYTNPDLIAVPITDNRVYDINSSYPATMISDQLLPYGEPVPEDTEGDTVSLYEIKITGKTVSRSIPFLPVDRVSSNINLYLFLRLNQSYYYTQTLKRGTVLKVTDVEYELMQKYYRGKWKARKIYTFKALPAIKIFQTYIEFWFDKKINSKGIERRIAKLFMNSLYGKYGQKSVYDRVAFFDEDFVASGKKREKGAEYTPWQTADYEEEPNKYLPLAVWITAHSRVRLIEGVGNQFKNFIYCDTDSVHVKKEFNSDHLEIHPSKLGAWKKEENKSHGVGIYLRPKNYVIYTNEKIYPVLASFYVKSKNMVTLQQVPYGFKTNDMLSNCNTPNGRALFPIMKEWLPLWKTPQYLPPESWFMTQKEYEQRILEKQTLANNPSYNLTH